MDQSLQEKFLTDKDQAKVQDEQSYSLDNSTKLPEKSADEDLEAALKRVFLAAGKLAISFFFNFSTRGLLVYFLKGSNKPVIQAAATLGSSLLSVLSMQIFISLNAGGLFYRLAHTYGAKNYKLMGLYLHRGCILNAIVLLICIILALNCSSVLRGLGYEEELLGHMETFINWSLPSLVGFSFFHIFNSYLNAADIFHVSTQVQILSCIVYVITGYLLMVVFDLGLVGAAWTLNIQQTVALIYILVYIYRKDPVPGTIFPLEEDSFKDLWDLFKYEVIAGAMLFLEYGGFELVYLFAGILSVAEIAGLMTALNCQAMFFAFALSISIATSSFVGNAMGEQNVVKAKTYLKVGLSLSGMLTVIIEIIVGIFAPNFASFYSNDPETIHYTTLALRLYMLVFPSDFASVVLAGGMRSIGKEKAGSMIVLVNLYFISMPLTALLVLVGDAGIVGVMMAFIVSLFLNAVCYCYQLYHADWEALAFMISRKLKNDQAETNSLAEKQEELKEV